MHGGEYERLRKSLDETAKQLARADLPDELAVLLLAEIEETKQKLRSLHAKHANAGIRPLSDHSSE